MTDEIRNKESNMSENTPRRGSENREPAGADTGPRHDTNRDPLTGARGSHPVGTGWDKAKHAARDAWDRLSGKGPHRS
jgi:hypothetical protein